MQNTQKMLLLACMLMLAFAGMEAVTVTIGTGTGTTQNLPIRARGYYSYSQQIYLRSQINQPVGGRITSISFYCSSTQAYTNSQSWTVYLGHTTKTSFSSNTDWVAVNTLTQVFNGNVSFGSGSWMTITLTTPFVYNNTNNLIVAVDENTSGRATGERNFGSFNSGSNTGIHINGSSNIIPSNPGTGTMVSAINRFMFNMETGLADPSNVTATPANENQINLGWQRSSGNDVMIAVNSSNSFGTPVTGTAYSVGDQISGGGQVIYNGSGTSFAHSGLTPNTTYYYKVWSKGALGSETIAYSPGVSVNASTPLTYYLLDESFTNTTFPPTGWTHTNNNLWTRSGNSAQFRRTASGNANTSLLITRALTIPANGYSVSFRMNRTATSGTEQLRVYINNQANLTGASQLGTINRYRGSSPTVRDAGWYKYTIDFPAGSTGTRYIIFEGYSTTTSSDLAIQIDDVSVSKITSTYPVQKPRFVAEWEPAKGAVVTYRNSSFGVPNSMIVDLSNQGKLYIITPSGTASLPAGTNTSNVVYITSALDSYWVRDFGPWTIFDGDNNIKFIDFEYNRARYNDNGVNTILADQLGYNLFPMNYVATGGNVMTDGYGKAMSTKLVITENTLLSEANIDQMFENYLGVTEYSKFDDPLLDSTIDHMDTWGKLLDVDKIMISSVPSNHTNYAALNARASEWANKISSYGTPYRVYRVECGSSLEPYINSFIYNKNIYVPIRRSTPNAQDNTALQKYREAMPGYTVTGYYINGWLSDDALHCRVNTIFDDEMLFVHHIPIQEAHANSFAIINATITSYHPLNSQETYVSYRFKTGTNSYTSWQTVPLTHVLGKEYSAAIPTTGNFSELQYTIHVTDTSGRYVDRSLNGRLDPYIVALEEVHYRTLSSTGNWNDYTIWECSNNLITWVPATVPPNSSNSASITIRNSHTVTLTQDVSADQFTIEEEGKLIINPEITLSIDDGIGDDLVINGYLTITGILEIAEDASVIAGAASTIEFNSSEIQETGAGFPTTANNIIVDNPNGLQLTNPITINGTLNQCQGEIAGEPAPDGYYSPLLNHLEFPKTGYIVEGWSINMSTPTLYPDKVNRQWDLQGSYTGTKTLTFYWTEEDDHEYDWLGLGSVPAVYYGSSKIASTIIYNVSSSPRSITVEISPQLSKGVYTIGTAEGETLPVELSSFTVNMNPHNQILLQWVSQSETNLVGYRIYRNTCLDFSQALMLNAFITGTNTSQMQVYTFCDTEIEANGTYYYWLESLDLDGTSCLFGPVMIIVDMEGFGAPPVPLVHGIHDCYPNPFNPSTTIRFGVKAYSPVKLCVYNQRGQLVKTLVNGKLNPGNHSVMWNGKDETGKNASSGIYLIKMQNHGKTFTSKMVLMK